MRTNEITLIIFISICTLGEKQQQESSQISEEEIKEFCHRHFDCDDIKRCREIDVSEDGVHSSCAELACAGFNSTNAYDIDSKSFSTNETMKVYCDMETDGGGWLVFQRRGEFMKCHENFTRPWEDYVKGFGNIEEEFWLGNEYLHKMTSKEDMVLRIDLEDFEGATAYAVYEQFKIASADEHYKLEIGGYSGTAGDGFGYANGMVFTTYDREDVKKCHKKFLAGWWYRFCHRAYLNGLYLGGKNKNFAKGVVWQPWRGDYYSLKWCEMKFRPRRYHEG